MRLGSRASRIPVSGRSSASAVAVGVILGVVLAGCAAAPATLPASVTVTVFQNRFDYSVRQLELKVTNPSEVPFTVTSATFDSARFVEPARWDRPQLIPAGEARDLRVQLPEPQCEAGGASDSVTLMFSLDDGRTGSAHLTPVDDRGTVDAINQQDCLGVTLNRHASVTAAEQLIWAPGAHAPARLDLLVRPTDADGSAVIHAVRGTVLFSLASESGDPVDSAGADTVIDARSADATIALFLIPNRCDPHAIEEDKRGTFFPLDVETSEGRTGTVYIAASDGVRRSLYEFYGDYCGLP